MKSLIFSIATAALLAASLWAANEDKSAAKDIQSGSTLMGCLEESGMGGYILTDGTGEGAMILSKGGDLKKHVGKWVKLDGESIMAGGIEHFRVRTATPMVEDCEAGMAANYEKTATAELINPEGDSVGRATFQQVPHGVLIKAELTNVPPGTHAIHIHENGACEPPSFESAGEHYNPTNGSHGFLAGETHHAGDMTNFEAPESGKVTVERINSQVSLIDGRKGSLFGDNGTALVIHSGADDYRSQPSGDAGERIACGVIKKAE